MDSIPETERPQRSYPPSRSFASANWRVKDNTPKPEPSPQPQPQSQRSNRSFNSNRNDVADDPTSPSSPAPLGTRLYVGNLLYTASRPDVEALFTTNGFTISGISMSIDPFSGRNPSYAFVDFETAEEANRAMEALNGMEVLGRSVKINPGVRKQENGSAQSRTKSYDGNRRPREERGEVPSNYKPTYDRWANPANPTFNNQAQDAGTRLYVGNLPRIEPQAAADAAMQSLFNAEGFELTTVSKMISPRAEKLAEPGNHYYCFVDLGSRDEAEKAIEALNGREVEGWGPIRVSRAKGERRERRVGGEGV